jgi:hypothetical protein
MLQTRTFGHRPPYGLRTKYPPRHPVRLSGKAISVAGTMMSPYINYLQATDGRIAETI